MEQVAGPQFHNAPVVECGRGRAGQYYAHVLDLATACPDQGAHVLGPLPARFIGGPADGQAAEVHDFEFAFSQDAGVVGRLEPLQENVHPHGPCLRRPISASQGTAQASCLFTLPPWAAA